MTRPTDALLPRPNPETPDRIPDLRTDLPAWHLKAACRGMDPDQFFPLRGESTRKVRAVCGGCAVSAECLDYAIDNGLKHGIWGGVSEKGRREVRRERRGAA